MFGIGKKSQILGKTPKVSATEEKEGRERANRTAKKKIEEMASHYLLTISPETYVASQGKSLADYNMIGIDAEGTGGSLEEAVHKMKNNMVSKALDLSAEVVVKVEPRLEVLSASLYERMIYVVGTALVPRKNNNKV